MIELGAKRFPLGRGEMTRGPQPRAAAVLPRKVADWIFAVARTCLSVMALLISTSVGSSPFLALRRLQERRPSCSLLSRVLAIAILVLGVPSEPFGKNVLSVFAVVVLLPFSDLSPISSVPRPVVAANPFTVARPIFALLIEDVRAIFRVPLFVISEAGA